MRGARSRAVGVRYGRPSSRRRRLLAWTAAFDGRMVALAASCGLGVAYGIDEPALAKCLRAQRDPHGVVTFRLTEQRKAPVLHDMREPSTDGRVPDSIRQFSMSRMPYRRPPQATERLPSPGHARVAPKGRYPALSCHTQSRTDRRRRETPRGRFHPPLSTPFMSARARSDRRATQRPASRRAANDIVAPPRASVLRAGARASRVSSTAGRAGLIGARRTGSAPLTAAPCRASKRSRGPACALL